MQIKLKELLKDRCVTYQFWGGEKEVVFDFFENVHLDEIDDVLDPILTACISGDCAVFGYQCIDGFQPEGVFGCILHELD